MSQHPLLRSKYPSTTCHRPAGSPDTTPKSTTYAQSRSAHRSGSPVSRSRLTHPLELFKREQPDVPADEPPPHLSQQGISKRTARIRGTSSPLFFLRSSCLAAYDRLSVMITPPFPFSSLLVPSPSPPAGAANTISFHTRATELKRLTRRRSMALSMLRQRTTLRKALPTVLARVSTRLPPRVLHAFRAARALLDRASDGLGVHGAGRGEADGGGRGRRGRGGRRGGGGGGGGHVPVGFGEGDGPGEEGGVGEVRRGECVEVLGRAGGERWLGVEIGRAHV